MAGVYDTKNIKLGVCRVSFGGVDLGYTKGGVDVSITTDTHEVNVDQYGDAPVNDIITSRRVEVTGSACGNDARKCHFHHAWRISCHR